MNGYSRFIADYIQELNYGEIFYPDMIADELHKQFSLPEDQAHKIVNNKLKRLSDAGVITRIQKGIYYKPQQTPFGATKPNLTQYAVRSLTKRDGRIIGYETGSSFMNRIGLSTLIPKNIEIASNDYQRKSFGKYHITVKRPAAFITDENFRYLQLLDVIDALPNTHTDAENVVTPLHTLMQKQMLDPLTLIFMARNYYPVQTTMRTIDIFAEGRRL